MITSNTPSVLADDIRRRFQQDVAVVDGCVRVERTNGHAFVSELIEAFPGQVDGIAVGKPTLEDVFLHHTGQRWN